MEQRFSDRKLPLINTVCTFSPVQDLTDLYIEPIYKTFIYNFITYNATCTVIDRKQRIPEYGIIHRNYLILVVFEDDPKKQEILVSPCFLLKKKKEKKKGDLTIYEKFLLRFKKTGTCTSK